MQRLTGSLRRLPLPEGTYAVGAGIVVGALTAYIFQIVAYRQLTTKDSQIGYSAVFGLWVIVFILTPGFFQPLEQEVGRAIAHRRAQGIGSAPLVKRAAKLGAALTALVIIASSAAAGPITSRLFRHDTALFLALIAGLVLYAGLYLARGVLAGNGRFGPYGVMLGAEGVVRLVATIALVVVGARTPGPWGFALTLPPALAVLIALRGQKHLLEPGPQAPYSELSTALGWLLAGSVLCQTLSYSAYLSAVVLETHAQEKQVGKFAAGIIVARIPILGFQAVQAALLPKLASLAGANKSEEFRVALRRLVLIVLAVGIVGVVGSFAVGHFAGRVLFGSKFTLGNRDLGLLAVGSGAFILALTLAQALIALRSYAAATLSWLAGAVGFAAGVVASRDLFLRSELGFAFGCLAAAFAMAVCLFVRLRRDMPLDATQRFVEEIEHEPLEL